MRFDLTDLRLFLNVVETGSLTHGAAGSNMALASASARLRGMEERLGHPLLERGRRGVEPTPAGDALAHHARLVIRQVELMHGELQEYAKGLRAQISVMANTAAISEFLPAAVAHFLAERPKVDIALKERTSSEIVKAIAGGFAEIGVISDAVDPGALEVEPFAVDRLVLAVPKGHPLAGERRISFEEAASLPMIGLSSGSALQDYLEEQAARIGRSLSYRIRVPTFQGICSLVEDGAGVAVIPEAAGKRYRRGPAIGLVRLSDRWATRRLLLCARQIGALSSNARGLFRHLAEAYPKRRPPPQPSPASSSEG